MGDIADPTNARHDEWVFGLWRRAATHETDRLRDLTISWTRFGYQGPMIEGETIEGILAQALGAGYRACLIQTPGHIISEDWYLPHWGWPGFHAAFRTWQKSENFFVSAGLIQGESYFGLNPECLLIDLKGYDALGRPEFGRASPETRSLAVPRLITQQANASVSQRLEPTGERRCIAPDVDGWGFVHAVLSHGFAIPSLPSAIDEQHLSLPTPEHPNGLPYLGRDIHRFDASAPAQSLNKKQQRFLTGVEQQLRRSRSGVFLWNIESYVDISEQSAWVPKREPISRLYSVAAGFKPNMLLHRHGYSADTEVVFFDYSEQALTIRKTLLEEWDGTDYPKFCRQLFDRYPSPETFYQLWNGLAPDQIDWADVERLWSDELAHWRGESAFRRQWQAQRQLNHTFLCCDIVADLEPLMQCIENTSGAAIWWSNAFFTISTNWLHSIGQRRQRYRVWIERLAQRCPDCRLYGADHNNTPVNGINAADYCTHLLACPNTDARDELNPNRQHAVPIRF